MKIRKDYTYIRVIKDNEIKQIKVYHVNMGRDTVMYLDKDHNLRLENGIIVFPNIKTVKDIRDRLAKFKDQETFWSAITAPVNNPPVEEQLANRKKFGDRTVQDGLLKKLGLPKNQPCLPYYCTISWLSGEYKFDVVGIDDALKGIYGDKYPDGMSMREFMEKYLGKEFADKFAEYI